MTTLFDVLDISLLAVVAIATLIPAYFQIMERRIRIEAERIEDTSDPSSTWAVRIIGSNKVLEEASVFYRAGQLRWADIANLPYIRRLPKDTSVLVRIPKDLEQDDGLFVIKDGKKVVYKRRYGKIPLNHQYS